MKRLAVVAALCVHAVAEGGWVSVPSGTANDLNAVDFAGDGSAVYAAGAGGTILKSADGGLSWVAQTSGTTFTLFAVRFPVDSMVGYAAGANGTILKTTDGGASWVPQVSGTVNHIQDLCFPVDDQTGYAVGTGGTILKTSNGGAAWTPLTSGTAFSLYAASFPTDATIGYVVGDSGTILKTTSGGASFSPLPSGVTNGLRDVEFPTATTGYAVGTVGAILRTVDGGDTWASQTPGPSALTGVRFLDPGLGYYVGFGGAISRTTDGGALWFRQPSGTTEHLQEVDFAGGSLGVAAGVSGTILRTTDGGDPAIALHPTQNGSSTAFSGSLGCPSGKWDCVNDQSGSAGVGYPVANDGVVSMIFDAAGVTRESFRLADGVVPSSAVVVAIELRAAVGIGAGTGQTISLSYQRVGFDASPIDGPAVILGAACCTTDLSWFVSGLSWTPAELDALEVGLVHQAGGEVQASQLYIHVTYQAPPPVVNYRSIGTAPDYSLGTVTATNGSLLVSGSGTAWVAANRGRGDRIDIEGVSYAVLSVDSETQLTLTSPYTGPTGAGKTYFIARQFNAIGPWESCVDGPPGCPFFPVASPSLVADNRAEVGIVYNDSSLPGDIVIDGSTTDSTHDITLTADGANRHRGIAGTGVFVYNFSGTSQAVTVRDDFVTLEWLEIHGSSLPGTDGIRVTGVGIPSHVALRNLIIREISGDAIEMADPDVVADVFNSVIYRANIGIRSSTSLSAWADVRLLNNTIYACAVSGIADTGSAPEILVVNNIGASSGTSDFNVSGLAPGSDHNLSTDATAPGGASVSNVPESSIGFVSTTTFSEDLHLLAGSPAADGGRDLSSLFTIDVDGGGRSAPWDIGADELSPAPAPTLSSAAAQSFAVGGPSQLASTKTVTDHPSSPTITALDDIRIQIPLGFSMRWNPSIAAVALGGSAAGRVDGSVKAYEDSGRTVVLDVLADFLPGDVLTVSGLELHSFTAPATPDHLLLEVTNDGVAVAIDDKTVDIYATTVPALSSETDQSFVVGSPPVAIVPFTISEASTPVITDVNDLRVRIPAGFNMSWNAADTSALLSGPGAPKVSATVGYEDSDRTLVLDVLSSFASGDYLTVSGLSFAGFSGASPADELELEVDNLGGTADLDDKRIVVSDASDVSILTATARNLEVEVEWVFPEGGGCSYVRIVRDTGGFAPPSGGTLVADAPCAGYLGMPFSAVDAVPSNGEYFYSAYVYTGASYTGGRFVKARPFDTSGSVKWAYSTGATSMAPPGLRFSGGESFVYVVSNDSILHALRGGTAGGDWPPSFEPAKLGRPAQKRPPVVSFAVGSASGAAFLGSEDGSVYAVDATDGSIEWVSPVGDLVLAAPAGYFSAFDAGATDLVLAGTRNTAAANALKALDVATGAPVWSFVNSLADGEGQDLGIINGGASVDYQADRIYFASRRRSGGSSKTLWAIDFTPSLLWNADLGNIDGSPVLHNGRVYVGTVAGAVAVRDAASGTGGWSLPLGDGAIKGFVFPRRGTNEVFVSTNTKVWAIADNTGSGAIVAGWPVTSIPSPSIPLHPPGTTHLLVGSSDGRLYQIDILSPSSPLSVLLGDGSAAVGAPTLDVLESMIYVGTDAGIIYALRYPLP